jgi:hypothetical protein
MRKHASLHAPATRPSPRTVAFLLVLVAAAWGRSAAAQGEGLGSGTDEESEVSLTAQEPTGEAAQVPWRGSEFIYRNTFTAYSLDPSADLTWNPYYAMIFGFKPRWWFDDHWYVGARLDVTRELTQADDTTFGGEAWLGDLLLTAGAAKFYTIPGVGIDLGADLLLSTPTSKISQGRTLVLGLGPGVRVSRTFDLGEGELSVGYHVRFSSFFHRYTTSELESPRIPTCSSSGSGCDAFVNTGERNAQFRVQHGIDVAYEPLEWLALGTGFEHIVDWLYPMSFDDPDISLVNDSPSDQRWASVFYFEATFTPIPALEIGVGYETISPQLAPDSTYNNPFFNRYTTLYLDLRVEVDGLVSQLMGEDT